MIFNNEVYFYLKLSPSNEINRQWAESNNCLGVETPFHDQKFWFGVHFPIEYMGYII